MGPAWPVGVSKSYLLKANSQTDLQQKTTQTTGKDEGRETAQEGSSFTREAFQVCPSTALPPQTAAASCPFAVASKGSPSGRVCWSTGR